MPTPRKATQIADLSEKLRRAHLAVVTDYRGLKVKDLRTLRRQLSAHDAELVVAKNTLMLRATREHGFDGGTLFAGPTAVAFCFNDIVEPSKVLNDFSRSSRILKVRGALLNGRPVDGSAVETIATLPPVDQLRAQVVGTMSAPLSGLVGVLNAVLQTFVATVEARVEQLGNAA
jgi:large subunit ribosomal protein L10